MNAKVGEWLHKTVENTKNLSYLGAKEKPMLLNDLLTS